MSEMTYDTGRVAVSTFTGPADQSPDRVRFQITERDGGIVTMNRIEAGNIATAILNELEHLCSKVP